VVAFATSPMLTIILVNPTIITFEYVFLFKCQSHLYEKPKIAKTLIVINLKM
jgi:hypothetical protein